MRRILSLITSILVYSVMSKDVLGISTIVPSATASVPPVISPVAPTIYPFTPTVRPLLPAYNPYYNAVGGPAIPILTYSNVHGGDGSYSYSFTTADGKQVEESGYLKDAYLDNAGEPQGTQVVQGSYAYVSPDGTPIQVNYVADENGFRPGVHISGDGKAVVPSIPKLITDGNDVKNDNILNPAFNRYNPYTDRNRYNVGKYNPLRPYDPRYPYDPNRYQYDSTKYPYDPARYPYDPARYPFDPARYPYDPARYPYNPTRHPYDPARYPYDSARYPYDPVKYPNGLTKYPYNPTGYPYDPSRYLYNPNNPFKPSWVTEYGKNNKEEPKKESSS